jgi:light-regulated signal transduction histidine kinase (bacteriophytochrome)
VEIRRSGEKRNQLRIFSEPHFCQKGQPYKRRVYVNKRIPVAFFCYGKKDFVEVMFDDFNTMAKELESIEMLKNDFIANVSHEIKTPLAVIQNYATTLQDDTLGPEERREYVKTIIASSQKLSALVSNILKLNKLENQKIEPAALPFDVSEQLRRCVLPFEELWERKNITIEATLDEITVCYDESMLEIVWDNLISNAVKFTAPGGSISLTLKKLAGFAVVRISDSGCGMDEETQKHIFDKFYQGDSSHSREGNGIYSILLSNCHFNLLNDTGQEPLKPENGGLYFGLVRAILLAVCLFVLRGLIPRPSGRLKRY